MSRCISLNKNKRQKQHDLLLFVSLQDAYHKNPNSHSSLYKYFQTDTFSSATIKKQLEMLEGDNICVDIQVRDDGVRVSLKEVKKQ